MVNPDRDPVRAPRRDRTPQRHAESTTLLQCRTPCSDRAQLCAAILDLHTLPEPFDQPTSTSPSTGSPPRQRPGRQAQGTALVQLSPTARPAGRHRTLLRRPLWTMTSPPTEVPVPPAAARRAARLTQEELAERPASASAPSATSSAAITGAAPTHRQTPKPARHTWRHALILLEDLAHPGAENLRAKLASSSKLFRGDS